jgi:hypothetical protein
VASLGGVPIYMDQQGKVWPTAPVRPRTLVSPESTEVLAGSFWLTVTKGHSQPLSGLKALSP